MSTFIVGHIDWFDHNLILERVEAEYWQGAVIKHSKFPFSDSEDYSECLDDPQTFKQQCFDCDCMMSWIEL